MFGSILHRMIVWELIKVFSITLIALTGLLLLAGVIAEATQRGLTPSQLLVVVPLLIPSTLPYTIPTTTLFATSLVYGRLAHDNEILAIKAAGVNMLKVVWPGIFLGLVMSALTFGLYYHFIPYSHQLLRSLFLRDVEEFLYTALRSERSINHPKLNYAIWVQKVEGRRLINPYFKRRNAAGHYDLIAHAKEAELRVDPRNNKVLVHMRHGEVYHDSNESRAYFEDRVFDLDLTAGPALTERQRKPRELTWQEILERRSEVVAELEKTLVDIALTQGQALLGNPAGLSEHRENLRLKAQFLQSVICGLDTELQMRPALSFGCLCFVLVGCPVGIWFSRSDYLSAFITSFLPIVIIYYPLLLCGTNLAKGGHFHPAVATWVANAVLVMIAAVLFRYLLKR